MTDVILVLNAGSSSIKFSIFALEAEPAMPLVYRGMVEGIGDEPRLAVTDASGKLVVHEALKGAALGEADHDGALRALLGWIDDHDDGLTPMAAGHRVVHGGVRFVAPVLIDAAVTAELEKRLLDLKPDRLLTAEEVDALAGRRAPSVVIPAAP